MTLVVLSANYFREGERCPKNHAHSKNVFCIYCVFVFLNGLVISRNLKQGAATVATECRQGAAIVSCPPYSHYR